MGVQDYVGECAILILPLGEVKRRYDGMFERLLFHVLLFISIVVLSSERVCAQKEEGEIVVISERVGESIDVEERNTYGLFPTFEGFQSAVLLRLPDESYILKITYLDETTGEEKVKRIPEVESRIENYIEHIDHFEEIQTKKYLYKKKRPIVPGTRVRISAPNLYVRKLEGTVVVLESDTLILKTDISPDRMAIPLGLVESFYISRGRVHRGKNGLKGAGIGFLIGGAGTFTVAAMSDDPRLIYGVVGGGIGGLDGFLIGATGKNATYGFLAGALIGFIIGSVGSDVEADLPEGSLSLMGAGFFGQIGMIFGAIVGATSSGERWEEVPLDRIQISVAPNSEKGFSLSASFAF
ncbi:MAG: hypothetical protein JSV84_14720 [Gemmatimonadota bacterium]|nr:MAG: hypothetical protein JSV84_14720 [Gemmatimonadota bacterium]